MTNRTPFSCGKRNGHHNTERSLLGSIRTHDVENQDPGLGHNNVVGLTCVISHIPLDNMIFNDNTHINKR